MTETGTVKACNACGKSLNGQKRMKDSAGRYWCMDCGKEDQRKKMLAAGGGSMCGGCGETFPAHQLSKWGGKMLCTSCSTARSKGPGIGQTIKGLFSGGSGQTDTGKLMKLVAIMVVLILLTIWRYSTL